MARKKRPTATAVFFDGKWLIGLPSVADRSVQPARVRLPLPERPPRPRKPVDK